MLFERIRNFGTFMFRVAGYELLELANGLILLLGAWAMLRPDTDLFSNGTAYSVLATLISENALGFIFLSFGLVKLCALLDGDLRFRQVVAFIITTFWSLLFGFMLIGNPTGMVYLWVGLFALISVVIAARLRVDMDNRIPSWTERV